MSENKNNRFDILEFIAIIASVIFVILFSSVAAFFAIFVYTFIAARWIVLTTLFRHKVYLPCNGYCDNDVVYKLRWLKENYRWSHIAERDIIQIADYPDHHYYGMLEEYEPCIRGVSIRFTRKKYAVHFKLVCYNNHS